MFRFGKVDDGTMDFKGASLITLQVIAILGEP
jgi:hypothetical protein